MYIFVLWSLFVGQRLLATWEWQHYISAKWESDPHYLVWNFNTLLEMVRELTICQDSLGWSVFFCRNSFEYYWMSLPSSNRRNFLHFQVCIPLHWEIHSNTLTSTYSMNFFPLSAILHVSYFWQTNAFVKPFPPSATSAQVKCHNFTPLAVGNAFCDEMKSHHQTRQGRLHFWLSRSFLFAL